MANSIRFRFLLLLPCLVTFVKLEQIDVSVTAVAEAARMNPVEQLWLANTR